MNSVRIRFEILSMVNSLAVVLDLEYYLVDLLAGLYTETKLLL